MRGRLWIVFAVAGALAATLVGCGGEDDAVVTKVFAAVPWTGAEVYRYNLVQKGGEVYGTCDLLTNPDFEPGRTQMVQRCVDAGGFRDERATVADSQTLRPASAVRAIIDSRKRKQTTFTSTYDEAAVRLEASVDGNVNAAERDLPAPTEQSPDPGYYDDEELLWVVRGIPLRDGYEGAYKNINAGNGRIFTVRIAVEARERVKVPAGEFNTWKVRVETQSITQYIWIDAESPHRIVKARIERLTYELASIGTSSKPKGFRKRETTHFPGNRKKFTRLCPRGPRIGLTWDAHHPEDAGRAPSGETQTPNDFRIRNQSGTPHARNSWRLPPRTRV